MLALFFFIKGKTKHFQNPPPNICILHMCVETRMPTPITHSKFSLQPLFLL